MIHCVYLLHRTLYLSILEDNKNGLIDFFFCNDFPREEISINDLHSVVCIRMKLKVLSMDLFRDSSRDMRHFNFRHLQISSKLRGA